MAKYIAAYDFGTSGVKAVIFNTKGTVEASCDSGYPLISPQPGYAEQDTNDYWNAVCIATRTAIQKADVSPSDIIGIAFGTQSMGIIPVDAEGNVLYNNITWLDGRAGAEAVRINKLLGVDAFSDKDMLPKYLWIKEQMPEMYEKTKYFLDVNGFLKWKATGKQVVELTDSFAFDRDPAVTKSRHDLLRLAGIDPEKFPPLCMSSEKVGGLTERAALELGLVEGTPVFGGSGDVPAACAGCGCTKAGDAHLYLGTSGWISVMMDKRLDEVTGAIYQCYSINPDVVVYGGCVQSACGAFNWAIDQLYHKEKEALGGKIFDLINEEVAKIEPGSGNLLATPWLFGERCPVLDEKAKMVFFNITNLHDRRHMINALMEGICYSLRWQVDYYRHDSGKDIKRIGAVGGGSLSSHWMQMMADILDMPVYVPTNVRHAGAIGSAVVAGVGLGLLTVDDVSAFVKEEKVYYPRETYRAVYDKLYHAFQKLYPSLRELYTELN